MNKNTNQQTKSRQEQSSWQIESAPNSFLNRYRPQRLGWAMCFTICVIVFELVTAPFSSPSPDLCGFIFIACVLSLASIVAIWCAVLNRWYFYPLAIVALIFNGCLLTLFAAPRFEVVLMLLPLAIAIPVSLTLEGIKLFFGKFAIANLDTDDYQEGLQFQTRQLFIATFAVAVICAAAQASYQFVEKQIEDGVVAYDLIFMVFIIATTLSISALVSVWTFMGKRIGFRAPVCLLAAIGLVAAEGYLLPTVNWAVLNTITSIPILTTAILLFLLRKEGYRFMRASKLNT